MNVIRQESLLEKVEYEDANRQDLGLNRVYVKGLGIIDDFMASDDLNECVDALLQKKSKLTQNMNSGKK